MICHLLKHLCLNTDVLHRPYRTTHLSRRDLPYPRETLIAYTLLSLDIHFRSITLIWGLISALAAHVEWSASLPFGKAQGFMTIATCLSVPSCLISTHGRRPESYRLLVSLASSFQYRETTVRLGTRSLVCCR